MVNIARELERRRRMEIMRRGERLSLPRQAQPLRSETKSQRFDVFLRVALFGLFIITENLGPFHRVIQPEEMWLYRYPIPEKSYFEEVGGRFLAFLLHPAAMIMYVLVTLFFKYSVTYYNPLESRQALYAFTLALPLTGTIVNIMKNIAGRPRPDFLARCYGTDYYLRYSDMSRECYRDDAYAQDGRKSFPSGHSALAACCFGFLAIYLAGQLGFFHERATNKINSAIVTVPILLLPIIVAISRTCDYKHHWQDVSVGLLIGFTITYLCYRIYFPSITDEYSHLPYICSPNPLESAMLKLFPEIFPVDGVYGEEGNNNNRNPVADQNPVAEQNPVADRISVAGRDLVGGRNSIADQNAVGGRNSIADRNAVGGRNSISDRNSVGGRNSFADRNSVGGRNSFVDRNSVGGRNPVAIQNYSNHGNQTFYRTHSDGGNQTDFENDSDNGHDGTYNARPTSVVRARTPSPLVD